MIGKPKFKIGDEVTFSADGTQKKGYVYVVDAYGNFFDDSDVSYDVIVENKNENCLYKHVNEKLIEYNETN